MINLEIIEIKWRKEIINKIKEKYCNLNYITVLFDFSK